MNEISRNISSSSRNNGNGTTQACAACKYQRRKCGPNCILAPYFPHDRQRQFLNAHKLFGVGKISNMIKDVEPHLRDLTMSTIIYQSDMRALDPVGGCYSHIQQLQSQINYLSSELHFTLQQLAFYRGSSSSSSSSQSQQQQVQLLNHHNYNQDHVLNNNNYNNNDINAMMLHHGGGSSLHAPPHAAAAANSHFQYVDEQQELSNVVEPNSEDIHSINYEVFQEEIHNWANSIPMSPLTLEDKKEEQHVHVDEKPVLGLINNMNSDAITRNIHPDHQDGESMSVINYLNHLG